MSAGNLKRDRLIALRARLTELEARKKKNDSLTAEEENSRVSIEADLAKISSATAEQEILIQSIRETLAPKLVADDVPLLHRYFGLLSMILGPHICLQSRN